jgi:hypothetical protein
MNRFTAAGAPIAGYRLSAIISDRLQWDTSESAGSRPL